ncbi:hypothetical protein [uncultured Tateyamaria sp.]|uniref:hypothetical protein n=1 Tax=uncultured Tateyamaria sp. TaxID=455651 RepID=UPI002623EA55|nr:hypothetical protein [uncultured Tateyamaria sp.]
MSGDFESFAQCFSFPYDLETLEGQRQIHTRADLKTTFDAVHAHLVKHQVTIMARHCVSASFRSDNEVAATHETRLLSRGILVQQPYPAFSLLKRGADGEWRITCTSYVIVDSAELNGALQAG